MTDPAPATTTTTADVYFGLVFELQGEKGPKEIVLEPKTAVNNIKEYGIECTLPERVSLGTVGSNIDAVLQSIGSKMNNEKIKKQVNDAGISALSGVYDKVSSAVLSIEQFHIKIPGSIEKEAAKVNASQPAPVTKYTVGVSATWPKESGPPKSSDLPGTLTLRGIYLTVSNEMAPPLPDSTNE